MLREATFFVLRGAFIASLIAIVVCSPFGLDTLDFQMAYAQQQNSAGIVVEPQGSSCGISDWFSDTTKCLWAPLGSWLGSWFLTFGGSILLLAGVTFDTFLQFLVIDFGETIQSLSILRGIQDGWTLFRDIANIAIIGVFVFVAVMTIIGKAEYGAKRLIAQVLIVAVLINFSLLFTRIIVEGTNFVSGQFARAMPGQDANGEISTARSFLSAFGIKDVWGGTSRITNRVSQQQGSGWAGLLYGIVGGVALLSVAAVLLYGVFMISARALLLIFSMLTASLAFASLLLPNTSSQPYIGWKAWWSNLIKASLFGPLLMVFLWITMAFVGKAANTAGAGAAIASLADDPSKTTPDAWGAIILLIIATGLMFVAIKAAGSFASSIGGFGLAATLSALPITAGSRFIAAPFGRKFFGRPALEKQAAIEEDIKRAKLAGNWKAAIRAQEKYNALGARAKSDFNPMNAKSSQWLAKQLGVSGFKGDKKIGGAAAQSKVAIKDAVENLGKLKLSKDEIEKIGKQGSDAARKTSAVSLKNAENDRKLADEKRKNIETEKRQLEEKHKNEEKSAQDNIKREISEDREMKQLRQQIANETDPDARKTIRQNMNQRQNAIEQEHAETMREVNSRIETARAQVNTRLADAQAEWETHNTTVKNIESTITDAGEKAMEGAQAGLKDAVKEMLPSGYRSKAMVEKVESEIGKARLKDRLKLMVEDVKADDNKGGDKKQN